MKYLLLIGLLILQNCATVNERHFTSHPEIKYSHFAIAEEISSDKEFEKFLQPYRERMNAIGALKIGTAEGDFIRRRPEGSLGNFFTDAILKRLKKYKKNIDFVILNYGTFRSDLAKGDILLFEVYEVIPSDNIIILVSLKGSDIFSLAKEIALRGGDPISGFKIKIKNGEVLAIETEGGKIEPEKYYTLAISDYLYERGGGFSILKKGKFLEKTPFLARDLIIEEIKEQKVIKPYLDGRIEVIK